MIIIITIKNDSSNSNWIKFSLLTNWIVIIVS